MNKTFSLDALKAAMPDFKARMTEGTVTRTISGRKIAVGYQLLPHLASVALLSTANDPDGTFNHGLWYLQICRVTFRWLSIDGERMDFPRTPVAWSGPGDAPQTISDEHLELVAELLGGGALVTIGSAIDARQNLDELEEARVLFAGGSSPVDPSANTTPMESAAEEPAADANELATSAVAAS